MGWFSEAIAAITGARSGQGTAGTGYIGSDSRVHTHDGVGHTCYETGSGHNHPAGGMHFNDSTSAGKHSHNALNTRTGKEYSRPQSGSSHYHGGSGHSGCTSSCGCGCKSSSSSSSRSSGSSGRSSYGGGGGSGYGGSCGCGSSHGGAGHSGCGSSCH